MPRVTRKRSEANSGAQACGVTPTRHGRARRSLDRTLEPLRDVLRRTFDVAEQVALFSPHATPLVKRIRSLGPSVCVREGSPRPVRVPVREPPGRGAPPKGRGGL